MNGDATIIFSDLNDIQRLKSIAKEREFSPPVRMALINQVEYQLNYIERLKKALRDAADGRPSEWAYVQLKNDYDKVTAELAQSQSEAESLKLKLEIYVTAYSDECKKFQAETLARSDALKDLLKHQQALGVALSGLDHYKCPYCLGCGDYPECLEYKSCRDIRAVKKIIEEGK